MERQRKEATVVLPSLLLEVTPFREQVEIKPQYTI